MFAFPKLLMMGFEIPLAIMMIPKEAKRTAGIVR